MAKQLIHIVVFLALTLMLLASIAHGQDTVQNQDNKPDAGIQEQSEDVPEEVMEYAYKYDLPAEEKSHERDFIDLPPKVKSGFNKSKYSHWEIIQVFEVEQEPENVFMFLLENDGYVETLHYNARGKLVPGF